MYKRFLVVACKKNIAGMNIVKNLEQFRKELNNLDIYLTEEETLYNENLDLDFINSYDFVIFACTHRSEKKEKALCIHAPGNWRDNLLGGVNGKVCNSSAVFQKFIFEKLNEISKEHNLDQKYRITLEATHHGPLIEKPCLFIEIGATETEWKDRVAGFVVAKTIFQSIVEYKFNPYREIAVAIGGPHYCPNFNKLQLGSNVAISHVIPSYSMPITEEMIKEAISKTQEEIDFVVLDWKGLGTSEQRQEVLNILDKNYIPYKKSSEIKHE